MARKEIIFKDPEFILMCAVNYCINRQTYAPQMLVSEIVNVWDDLQQTTKDFIKKEIKHDYCNQCWKQILDL